MKLVYLIAATCNSGGMERVLAGKANWFAARGHEVAIVTTDQRGREPYFPLDERIKTYDLDINYDTDNGHLLSKLLHYPLRQWRHRRRLTTLLKRLKADVVICMFNNDVAFVHKIQDGSHKVLEIHFSKNKKLQYGRRGLWALADHWRTRQEEKMVSNYDRFVVLTHEDAALWGNLPNMAVIPNARTFQPERQADLSRQRVLAIGRYDYQKGFDRLIDIWERGESERGESERVKSGGVKSEKSGWTLDIIGDGPLRPALQEQIQRLGLQDSVRLLKPTSHVQDAYLGASIFVLTSRYEGLPMVLLEAQACGLPIVAFTCQCGPRDVVTDGNDGFLIPDGNEDLFAEKLSFLMEHQDERERMGTHAREASDRFSEQQVMRAWEKLLGELRPQTT